MHSNPKSIYKLSLVYRGMMPRYVFLDGLLMLLLFQTALGELTSFKLIYGGSGLDAARDIYVDSSGI